MSLASSTISVVKLSRKPLISVFGSIAIVLIASAMSISASAQDFYSPPTELSDQIVGAGSPALVYFDGSLTMFYVKHGNAPNQIYEDKGLNNEPIDTGITPYTGGLIDVGASTLANGDVIISYINSSGQVSFATSSPGGSFSSVVPSSTSLGLPSGASPNSNLVPALTNLNGVVYIATVSSANNEVYISSTIDGTSFTPYTPGVPATTYTTISRPSLTVHLNGVWLGFLSGSNREAIVGAIANSSTFSPVGRGGIAFNWSDSHTNGYYAGVSLADVAGTLYLVGQSDSSQQYLEGTSTTFNPPGLNWTEQAVLGSPNLQEHWTPSLLVLDNSYLYCAFQDDSNNNISYTNDEY